jgi:prolyl-tRNA editing enzyme YbaK/EbsC (Cys-tRNA(Pro) deacylase)
LPTADPGALVASSLARLGVVHTMTGMLVGGVAPFGLPEAVPVLVDAAVMERPEIVLGGGGRDTKLRLAPGELRKLPGLQVVPGLAHPR